MLMMCGDVKLSIGFFIFGRNIIVTIVFTF